MRPAVKIVLGALTFGVTLAIVSAGGLFFWAGHEFTKPGPTTETTEILIESGDNIAEKLQKSGIIKNPLLFKLAGRVTGQATRLKAGEYEIPAYISMKALLNLLEEGKTIQRRVTVPEGLTAFEIIRLLNETQNLTGTLPAPPAEGTLLPNSYDYQKGEDRNAILKRMENSMYILLVTLCGGAEGGKTPTPFPAYLDAPCGDGKHLKTVRDVLTLASIVEKETGKAEERARIAGVFLNRLERTIPLQTDPTVIYALTKGEHKNEGQGPLGRRLLSKDLEIDSPYNTYKYAGLPPTPIANPGKAAIEAVLKPEKHDLIYFVADGTGGHFFARTLTQHNANVAKWRKLRREAERKKESAQTQETEPDKKPETKEKAPQ